MKRLQPIVSLLGMAALALPFAAGCAADEDPDEIASALELENGGLDMEDEAPLFGDEDLFDSAGITATDPLYADPIAEDVEVETMTEAPDALLYHTTILWGQIPGNPDNTIPRDWSGEIRVNRGAILVRRLIAFEPATDALSPRTDRTVVALASVTLPHMDGLRLTLIDPTPLAEEPMVLEYAGDDGTLFAVAVTDLTGEPQSMVVDENGNRIVAVAFRRPVGACEYGFLGGKWHRVAEGRGRILGRVTDADGEPIGYVKGLYGRRLDGQQVFFGKYIDLDGHFRGLFKGGYQGGHFAGRWIHAAGEFGVLGGEYRESIPGPETGGHFLGRWAETSCNVALAE